MVKKCDSLTSKITGLQSILSMPECFRTYLLQYRVSTIFPAEEPSDPHFSEPSPYDSLRDRRESGWGGEVRGNAKVRSGGQGKA